MKNIVNGVISKYMGDYLMDEDIEKIVEDELKIGSTYKEIREKIWE